MLWILIVQTFKVSDKSAVMSIWSSVSFSPPSGYLHGFLFIFDYDASRCVLFVIYPAWGSPSILDFHDFWQILSHYAFKEFFCLITSLFSFVEFYLPQSSWMLCCVPVPTFFSPFAFQFLLTCPQVHWAHILSSAVSSVLMSASKEFTLLLWCHGFISWFSFERFSEFPSSASPAHVWCPPLPLTELFKSSSHSYFKFILLLVS